MLISLLGTMFFYRSDSGNGTIKFTDVTSAVAQELISLGMVCDALWTDFDNDGWQWTCHF